MLSQRQNNSYLEDQPASVVVETAAKADEPAPRLVVAKDGARACHGGAGPRPWAAAGSQPHQTHKFMRGLSIALPLSVSLWAFMIWGIRAIW
jgi:hypothetical protein